MKGESRGEGDIRRRDDEIGQLLGIEIGLKRNVTPGDAVEKAPVDHPLGGDLRRFRPQLPEEAEAAHGENRVPRRAETFQSFGVGHVGRDPSLPIDARLRICIPVF